MSKSSEIFKILNKHYPEAKCELNFTSPWQLLVATILSAQCTDKRVNIITTNLFQDFPDAKSTESATLVKLISLIKSAGFYNNKAKFIKAAAAKIVNEYNGEVPAHMDQLIKIPGVARKTANVVLGVAYNVNEGIAVDTHVKRLAQRLGLSQNLQPEQIEKDLMKLFENKDWEKISTLLIHHGRNICKAQNPNCAICPLNKLCPSAFMEKRLPLPKP